jgi:hypothetical protein
MGEDLNWKKICEADYLHNCQNHLGMDLIYGRIYTSRGGFECSRTNQLIHNLKKPFNASSGEIHYKNKAIIQFAEEALNFLKNYYEVPFIIVPMPSSKKKTNPEYDNRIERVAQCITLGLREKVICLELLYGNVDRDAAHQNNQVRTSDIIYNSMNLDDDMASQVDEQAPIVVIDDVLTSGAHFSAAYRHLNKRFPSTKISGLFWAKSQDPSDFIPI